MARDTKTALLDAAEIAARTRGFDGFSYADLADAVGIKKASIHHHFPTKADLSLALIKRYHLQFEAICKDIDKDHALAGYRLDALINRYRDALGGGCSLCLCVAFSISSAHLPAQTIKAMDGFRAMMTAWLTHTFEKGQQDGSIQCVKAPKAEAAATLPLLEGAQLAARVAQDATRFDSALGLLRARLPKPHQT